MRGARFEAMGCELAVIELEPHPVVMPESLTAHERQVAALVLEGLTTAEMAETRGTSPRTIANQLASIYRKLGVASRAELVIALGARGDEP